MRRELMTRRAFRAVIGAVALCAVFGPGATIAADGKPPARVPLPSIQIDKAQGEKCVEPTEVMRRSHMDFILHQRDETMHRGIRTVKHSLKNCVNCHADAKSGSVLGKNGFCESCHNYAAVSIDCFGCHTSKAEPRSAAAGRPAGGAP